MIRKKALSLFLTVLVALSLLGSAQAIHTANHNLVAAGSHANVVLTSDGPSAAPMLLATDPNPSGGGNGGG